MKNLVWIIALFAIVGCTSTSVSQVADTKSYSDIENLVSNDTLSVIFEGEEFEIGMPCGYINQKGDTIMPIGQYSACFSEEIINYGVVVQDGVADNKPIGIDRTGNVLYEIYWYDNGPDYAEDGLFRIRRNGKIGYADVSGKVVIAAQFSCAFPFSEGRARVAYDCEEVNHPNDEHTEVKSDTWFFIDTMGNKVE